MYDIPYGSSGITITFTILDNTTKTPIDLTGATVLDLIFTSERTEEVREATFTTDGTDGKLYYVTQAGDLMEKGTWKVCARVVTGTYSGTTSKITFYAKGAS